MAKTRLRRNFGEAMEVIMRSREDFVIKLREALRHSNADLLFEIGLEEPTPTQAARAARAQGLSNEEEKLVKWIAVFKRDHGEGWFRALREILENSETENSEMGLTKTQKKALESVKQGDIQEAIDTLMARATGQEFVTLKPAFDPRKIKEEHLRRVLFGYHPVVPLSEDVANEQCEQLFGMKLEEALEHIPDPEPGHENYLLVVNCLPLAKLMKFVVVGGQRGESLLNENKIEDAVEVPSSLFYWRYDVGNDVGRRAYEWLKIDDVMNSAGAYRSLTARELICVLIPRPELLEKNSERMFYAGASHCYSKELIPVVFLEPSRTTMMPKLYFASMDSIDRCEESPRVSTPICRK